MTYEFDITDYKGRVFDKEVFVARDAGHAPGWFVWGRCSTGVIKVIARPDVRPRRHPHFNIKVRRGWHTMREAEAVADEVRTKLKPTDEAA